VLWPEIPPQLDLVLFAMLAKDPAHRPTLEQVRAVLAAARNNDPQRAETEFVGVHAARTWKRSWTVVTVVLATLVGGITIGARLAAPSDPDVTPAPPVTPTPTPTTPHAPPAPTKQPTATPIVEDPKPDPPSRNTGSGSRGSGAVRPPLKAGSAVAVPIDAGVGSQIEPPPVPEKLIPIPVTPTPKPGIDRNQTVNPFAKKRPKVNP
jgi:hypothetical protein